MNKYFFIILGIILCGFTNISAQKFSLGGYSGLNFSNLNNEPTSGKWKSMPGPQTGISANYHISKAFYLNSGLDFYTLYYNYNDYYSGYWWEYLSSKVIPPYYNSMIMPPYNYYQRDWSLSYLRLPLLLGLKTPGKFSFEFSAGMYYSWLIGDNLRHDQQQFPSTDYGYIFLHGFTYTFDNNLQIGANLQYFFGREKLEAIEGKNAATSVCFKLGYRFGGNQNETSDKDSISPFFFIGYSAGATMSVNAGTNSSLYKPGAGYNLSLSLIYHKTKGVSFETGLIYQRNSYWLNDSSTNFFIHKPKSNVYDSETRTDLTYISLPLIINFWIGKKEIFYAGVGLYGAVQTNANVVGDSWTTSNTDSYLVVSKYHVNNSIEGYFYDYDAGWIFNLGFEPRIFSKLKLDFKLRYMGSFKNIYKYDSETEIKLKSLSVNAGILIPIL
ncbi:MAG: outer membrane beta-barrel protein [Bacteroidales bacterium]